MALASGVRSPTIMISLDGAVIPCVSGSATVAAVRSSSTYSAFAPIDTLAAAGFDLDRLSGESKISGQLLISQDAGSAPVALVSGPVDDIFPELLSNIVGIHGRDNSVDLHNTKNNKKYLNHTSQQILSEIAGSHGLTLNLVGSFSGMIGKKFKDDFARLTDGETDWTVIQRLAEIEGARCFITGQTLNFIGQQQGASAAYTVVYAPPSANNPAMGDFLDLRLRRNLNLGMDIEVTTSAWDPKRQLASKSVKTLAGSGGTLRFEYRASNLKQDQLEKHSRNKAMELARHELGFEALLNGDTAIDPTMQFIIQGTNSLWDQPYEIDAIEHMVDDSGYHMSVHGTAFKQGRSVS